MINIIILSIISSINTKNTPVGVAHLAKLSSTCPEAAVYSGEIVFRSLLSIYGLVRVIAG